MAFTRYTFDCTAVEPYKENWHHSVIAEALDRVERGELKRLMVFTPPGAGKSELISRRFPAYCMGRDQTRRIVAGTYNATLAEDMGRDCKKIMVDPSYGNVFPKCILGGKASGDKFTQTHFQVKGSRGSYYGTGVDGTLTGKRFEIGLIDDPCKNRAEAESVTVRESVWRWYTSTFRTRRADPRAAIVIVMTRWHEDDLAGRLLAEAADGGEQWEVIWLPAICEPDPPYDVPVVEGLDPRELGEALWPAQADLEDLHITKRLDARDWTSLYQQRPAPAEGKIFLRKWFRYYRHVGGGMQYEAEGGLYLRKVKDLIVFSVVDLAASLKEEADYTVISTWGLAPDRHLLLLGVHRDKIPGEHLVPTMKAELDKWGSATIWIESVGMQLALVKQAIAAGLPAREVKRSKGDGPKLARAWSATSELEQGLVLWPAQAEWLAEWESELLGFPGKHDDQVDTLSDAVVIARMLGVVAPEPPEDPEEDEGFQGDSELADFPDDDGDFDDRYPWRS